MLWVGVGSHTERATLKLVIGPFDPAAEFLEEDRGITVQELHVGPVGRLFEVSPEVPRSALHPATARRSVAAASLSQLLAKPRLT